MEFMLIKLLAGGILVVFAIIFLIYGLFAGMLAEAILPTLAFGLLGVVTIYSVIERW